jgi:arylsulfatase A-like enzyme
MRLLFFILLFPVFLSGQSSPNIIFFIADDVGNGDVGFNASYHDTPNIDSLKRNGANFTRFYSRVTCTPTRFSFMTGKHSFRHPSNLDQWVIYQYENVGLDAEYVTVPERLKEHGYSTAMLGKWHLGNARPEYLPNAQGFDYFIGATRSFRGCFMPDIDEGLKTSVFNGELYDPPGGRFITDLLVDSAKVWIDRQARDTTAPFFLYFPFINVHADNSADPDTLPYASQLDFNAAPAGYTTGQKRRYAFHKNMDDAVGSIWQKVRDLGIEENTIIIFVSDNGARVPVDGRNDPYSGTKATLAEGGIRVPMVWYHLGTVSPGITVDSVVAFEDFTPTFIEGVLGSQIPKSDTLDGVNFYPLLTGGTIPQRSYIGSWIPDYGWTVIRGKYKLVNNKDAFFTVSSASATLPDDIELFDVVNDPTESTDLSATYPGIVLELQAIIDAEPTPARRDIDVTEPPGWTYGRWWSEMMFYYNSSYEYYIDIKE